MPITVTHNLDRLREAIAAASIGAKVNVRSLGDSLVVEGMVRDPLDAEEVRRIAAGFAGEEKVINRLKVLAPTQVNLRVRVAEVRRDIRSEEHTSELQSLMRISYAVFCLKQKKKRHTNR